MGREIGGRAVAEATGIRGSAELVDESGDGGQPRKLPCFARGLTLIGGDSSRAGAVGEG